ncbi:hypothetical protein JW960_06150 [candidate division KSB1 bacterium]|nr:hypothetical protein [candidate division KSB1 bacterium]
MKRILLLIVIAGSTHTLRAQSVDIFGYVEPQLMVARVNGTTYQLNSNKLRLDLEAKPSDRVTIGANINFLTYHGKTQWSIPDFLPRQIQAEIPDFKVLGMSIDPYVLPYNDRQYLDNTYVKLNLGPADLTVGKQQLSFGTGYVWNPTDVYNQKDVLDPTYEQPGHNALRLDIPLSNRTTFTTVYSPNQWDESGDMMMRAKTTVGHFDLSVSGAWQAWALSDARVIDMLQMNFYQVPTRRTIVGGDLVGELLGIGVWMEAASHQVKVNSDDWSLYQTALNQQFSTPVWSSAFVPIPALMEIRDDYYELVAGMDYTFDSQMYIMTEFYRNTWAKSSSDNYRFNDWMQVLAGEVKTIARDQIYALIQYPATDLVQLSCSVLAATSDNSGVIIPMITWNIFENVDVTLIGNYYYGKDGTAYSKLLGNGGLTRVRVYF